MQDSKSDEQLIDQIRSSEFERELAVKYIYTNASWRNIVFSQINKLISTSDVAEDVYKDSIIILIKNIRYNKYKGHSKLKTYFIGICKIVSLRYLDKKKKDDQKTREINEHMQSDNYVQDEGIDVFNYSYEKNLTRRIYKQLSETCRKIFRQKYFKKMKDLEVAKANDVNLQSVKNTNSRCKKKLRELIMKDEEVYKIIETRYGRK